MDHTTGLQIWAVLSALALIAWLRSARSYFSPLKSLGYSIRTWWWRFRGRARRNTDWMHGLLERVRSQPQGPVNQVYENDGLKIILFDKLSMFDWDMGKHCQNKEEVLDKLAKFASEQHVSFRLYLTPAGVRAFMLASWLSLESWTYIARGLGCDPAYIECCQVRGGWACRVGPKKKRENDWVAQYWCTVGTDPLLEAEMQWIKLHDEECKRNRPAGVEPPTLVNCLDTRDGFLRAIEEEPWEQIHRLVLQDWDQEHEFEPDQPAEVEWVEENTVQEDLLETEEIPF